MASPSRNYEREEERRVNMRTLAVASVASASAAAVTSQLWIHGTWIAAALTPVLVALISDAMHRPTERIARVWTSERPAPAGRPGRTAHSAPPTELGPVRVYRQPSASPARRRLALGAVAATAAIAFVIGIVALTTADLIAGDSIGKGSGTSSLVGGGGDDAKEQQEAAPDDPAPKQETPTDEAPPAEEPAPEEPPPTDTAPAPPPEEEAPPGEPLPDQLPSP
jgi:hypothetical protein